VFTTVDDTTLTPSTPPSPPRLFLANTPPGRTILQGGWWPRSWDPLAELPGLVLALTVRYGPVCGIDLNPDTWNRHFTHLALDAGIVRLGWPATIDPDVLTAIHVGGNHLGLLDLLVVPPGMQAETATRAMRIAADPSNTRQASEILTPPPQHLHAVHQPARVLAEPGTSS